ncbi:DUF11 domain-containing protein [Labedella phragmitis]|uniref:DUF11 domain-containing protein n=1 Tax=Labedella phragmitis TaxID=2498849 RepID=A0A444PY49_9MICO|nr:DUF11 domain-containing protein [Labedella phragmitis]
MAVPDRTPSHTVDGERRLIVRRPSRFLSALLSTVLGVASLTAGFAVAAAPASAVPGTPGTPQANSVAFEEDFEYGVETTPVLLTDYTSATGQEYTADPVWLTNCNGQIRSFDMPSTTLGNCASENYTSNLGQLAYALGANNGDADPGANGVVAAYTENNPGANAVEFQTATNIPLASASGRFLTFSVDTAAVNCQVSAPQYQFAFLNEAGTATNIGGQINACSSSNTVAVPAYGNLAARSVNVDTYTSNGSVLFTGSTLGIRMTNANGSGIGNDAAFDNIRVLDVTPQLDKSFSPTSIRFGQTSTLTFTVTNTEELAAKNGWSFTDALPEGLSVADPSNAATTCSAGVVTAAPGADSVAVSGNLDAGQTSCTVTVTVAPDGPGSYTNGPDNVTTTGLNPPGESTLTVADADIPLVTCTTDPVIFNTGHDATTGGQTPDGALDQRWTVAGGVDGLNYVPGAPPAGPSPAALPPAGTTYSAAFAGKGNALWDDSLSGESQWISANYVVGQNQSAGYGTWYYRYQFELDAAVEPTSFELRMNWMADNSVNGVWVNDEAQTGANLPQSPDAPYVGAGFFRENAASTTLDGPWQTGLNTILVEVKSASPAQGFNAEVESVALCPAPSYTVAKTSSVETTTEGGTVAYSIAVTNTGNVPYTADEPASFSDDLSGVLDDAAYNGDASNGATLSGETVTWSGPLALGETVTITYSVTVDDPVTGDHILENAVLPTGPGGVCSPEDGCTTTTEVASYTTTKTASSATANPGDTITYTVTVTNTGAAAYTAEAPAAFDDDLSAVLDDATYNGDATNGAVVDGATLTWSGALAVDEAITIVYSVTVAAPGTGDGVLTNAVVPTGPGGECVGECTTTTELQSYSVAKTSSAATVNPGDVVTYTVTVTNTGTAAYMDEAPASFTDDLTAVLDDATYNDDASNGATVSGVTLTWSGPLAVGDVVTITYSVTVASPVNGDNDLRNVVVPTGPGGDCETEGGCETSTLVQSYTATKTADTDEVVLGDTVTYTVVLENSGEVAYTDAEPATFTDDLTAILDDATYNDDASNGATYAAPTIAWSGPLAIGETVTITYSVTVNDPATGDGVMPNAVVTGVGGNCEPGSNDPACLVEIPAKSFTVAKSASDATATPGGTLTYTVTVTNTGKAAYTAEDPASFADDLSGVLDDAAYNDDASNGAVVSGDELTWSGPLAVGETIEITYSVTVDDPIEGDESLANFVRPTSPGGECATEDSCSTTTPVRSFEVVKTVDATSIEPGATVTYTITITNTGTADYTDAAPASFTDDMSDVLDDAAYNDDATNGATYAAPVLSWSGALGVGEDAVVTYSVTVNASATGDGTLTNAVVTPLGGNCVAGSDDADCAVSSTVVQPPLAVTGAGLDLVLAALAAALTIAMGLGIVMARRRSTVE